MISGVAYFSADFGVFVGPRSEESPIISFLKGASATPAGYGPLMNPRLT